MLSAVGLALAAGCSKASSSSHVPPGNACDRKLITPAQVADILRAPIVEVRTIVGDPQTCEFKTAGTNSVSISLRPGLGDVTVKTWLDGRMPMSASPLPGVGDRAAWVADLGEVVATKANVLCDIQTTGGAGPTGALQQKIGALCNTILAGA
jgi:hypothetical protein